MTDQVVAQFDPTLLLNGQYTIYLHATDMGGNVTEDSAVVTGDMKIGNFSQTFEEISIPVAGIPVTVSRTYDTRRRNEALDFGRGWSVDYQNVRVHESRKLGFSWLIREIRDGTITRYCSESNGTAFAHRAIGSLSDFMNPRSHRRIKPRGQTHQAEDKNPMAQNDTAKSGNGGSLGCEADLFKAADKHVALQVADTLPSGATWDDVRYQIELRASVEHGLADSRAGRLIPVEELLREFGLAE